MHSPIQPSPIHRLLEREAFVLPAAPRNVVAFAATSQPSTSFDLKSYILQGPLLGSCGISEAEVSSELANWSRLGARLAKQLQFGNDLNAVEKLRIYHYYLPVYFWCLKQLAQHRARHTAAAPGGAPSPALVLGISAPQGCGKTTLVEQLQLLMAHEGVSAASVSIDDFYLSFADQSKLAQAAPDNKLLQYRGNAGTHDLALGSQTLATLRGLTAPGARAAVPRYNKSAHQGRGDRADPSTWPQVSGPLDVVLFEGWMSGFAPLPADQASAVDPSLAQVNEALGQYKQAWDSFVDSWLVIRIGDPQWVYKWRLQAEEKMKEEGKAGMTDAQLADFVSRFMPAYQAYLPGLYSRGPTTAQAGRTLVIEVDQNRSPVTQQPKPLM